MYFSYFAIILNYFILNKKRKNMRLSFLQRYQFSPCYGLLQKRIHYRFLMLRSLFLRMASLLNLLFTYKYKKRISSIPNCPQNHGCHQFQSFLHIALHFGWYFTGKKVLLFSLLPFISNSCQFSRRAFTLKSV